MLAPRASHVNHGTANLEDSMLNTSQAIPHLTIDDIESDLVAFGALLDMHGQVMLVDGGVPIARLLPPTHPRNQI